MTLYEAAKAALYAKRDLEEVHKDLLRVPIILMAEELAFRNRRMAKAWEDLSEALKEEKKNG